MIPSEFKGSYEVGSFEINRHCIVGSKSTILPNIVLNEGSSVGANSLVKDDLRSWTLYAGIPAKKIKVRDSKEILHLEKKYLESINE